jgi:hypothetical protein
LALGFDREQAQQWLTQQEEPDPSTDPQAGTEDGQPGEPPPGGALLVWPCNWDVLRVFVRLQTQWRRTPSGSLIGLPYRDVESTLRMMRLWSRSAELFDQLAEMELATVEAQADEQH